MEVKGSMTAERFIEFPERLRGLAALTRSFFGAWSCRYASL